MKDISRVAGTVLLAAAVAVGTAAIAGCHGLHPDRQAAVYQSLSQHDMLSVEVSQDRYHGVMTLKGIVGSANSKTQAAQLAEQAAPGYTVNNQLTVHAIGLMGLANPNARPPEVVQMAHPPVADAAKADQQH